MKHLLRFSRFIPVVAILGLLLTMALSAPLSQSASADKGGVPNGGNSANAKLCQNGGWQDLMNSNGAPFASEEECTSSGAQGLGVVPIPTGTIEITFDWLDVNSCEPNFTLIGFAPSTVVDVQLWGRGSEFGGERDLGTYSAPTDADGNSARTGTFWDIRMDLDSEVQFRVPATGSVSAWTQVAC